MTTSTSISLDAQEYPIAGVQVFTDRAEVTRTFALDLKAGANEIDIKCLPSSLDPNTIRVQGVGKGVLVIDVIHKPPKAIPFGGGLFRPPQKPTESEKMRQLNAHKALLEGERKVLDSQAEILVGYAKTLTAENTTPENFLKFMQSFNETGRSNLEAIKEKEASIATANDEIQRERERPPSEDDQADKRKNGVSIVAQAEKDVKAELTLIYVVPSASWKPAYDIRSTTENDGLPSKTITLNYRASITQNSGEDWKNTSLTLSTAQSRQGNVIPVLSALTIREEQSAAKKEEIIQQRQLQRQQQNFGPAFAQQGNNNNANNLFGAQNQQAFGQLAPVQPAFGVTNTAPAGGHPIPAPVSNTLGGFGAFGGPTPSFVPQSTGTSSNIFAGASQTSNAQVSTSGSAFGLFGQPRQPPAIPFGAAPSTTSTSLFGSAPTTSTSLFGSAPAFGASTATSSVPAAPGGGLFGSTVPQPSTSEAKESPSLGVRALPDDDASDDDAADHPFDYASAVTAANSLAATYKIEGKTTIPSDSSTHKVAVSTSIVLSADISVVTVPRAKLAAFWEAKVTNTSGQPLLAGPVSIFYDESYVTSTWLPLTNPDEIFICSLGMNNSINVQFYHTRGKPVKSTYTFAAKTETVQCGNNISIKNNGSGTVPRIIVRDSIPSVQEPSPFKVILDAPAKLATTETKRTFVDVSDGVSVCWSSLFQQGCMEWIVKDLEKGKTKRLETRWTVENPVGLSWTHHGKT